MSCAKKSGLMLFQYPGHLELWRLGESEEKCEDDIQCDPWYRIPVEMF